MVGITLKDFKSNLSFYLSKVENTKTPVQINLENGKSVVLVAEREFNSLIETLHLLGSKKNADRIYDSIQQMNTGRTI